MASLRSKLLIAYFRLTRSKQVFLDTSRFDRSIVDSQRARTAQPPRSLYRRLRIESTEVRGYACVTLSPVHEPSGQHVLYLHGGAYVHSVERAHWHFVGQLVEKLNCTVTVPVYPLAPDNQYDQTQAMIEEAYDRYLASVDAKQQVIMGDSAGGALTLVQAMRLREQGRAQPAHLVLLSPWLDITMRDPAVPVLDRRDPYLSTPGLLEAARMYAGGLAHSDSRLSPIYGTFTGLGRISVFIGTRDVLLADSRRLRGLLADQGISFDYIEYQDMFHGWLLQRIPEARQATAQLAGILKGESLAESG